MANDKAPNVTHVDVRGLAPAVSGKTSTPPTVALMSGVGKSRVAQARSRITKRSAPKDSGPKPPRIPRQRRHAESTVARTMNVPGPFDLTTFGDGTPKKLDWKTRAALEEAERRLGYPLTIVQEIGPISVAQALQAYAYLSAATGGIAVANVAQKTSDDTPLADF